MEFVELTIQQFIPRAKTLKEDASHPSALLYSISKEENSLIARYFGSSGIHTWKPSLIAFPGFQCFPSRIHTVRHSFKTTAMLIDTMQSLGELSFSKSKKDLAIEVSLIFPLYLFIVWFSENCNFFNLYSGLNKKSFCSWHTH